MSGPMQRLADGTWVPAITPGRPAPPPVSDDDEFAQTLKHASPPITLAPSAPIAKPTARKAPQFKTENVLSLAKARLKEVKAALKQMSALEKERAELERLIEAAENKPKAAVSVLKMARNTG